MAGILFTGSVLLGLLFSDPAFLKGQSEPRVSEAIVNTLSMSDLPDAPQSAQLESVPPGPDSQGANAEEEESGNNPVAQRSPRSPIGILGEPEACLPFACSPAGKRMTCSPNSSFYLRFLNTSAPVALTPKQKFFLAWKDVRDPFNLLTIGGEAAISIGSNSRTAYGPGFAGFGKYAGVSLTQDIGGEFFSTFLIPSLAHEDPHYHRMPNRSIRRRIVHVMDAVVIAQGDDGQPMFNYATVFGTIANSALGNLYVPGRHTSWGASVARISVTLATDPIGYSVAEFLPDVARHININVVLVQRVINRIAVEEGAAP